MLQSDRREATLATADVAGKAVDHLSVVAARNLKSNEWLGFGLLFHSTLFFPSQK